jgi:hypothetical protein
LWAVVVFGLHAMAASSFPKISIWENVGMDKVVHAFIFFVATSLAFFSGWNRKNAVLIWIVAGLLLELYQSYWTTDRFFDWFDLLADVIGIILSLLIFRKHILN